MTIAILGAGSIGCYLGGTYATQAAEPVILLGRPRIINEIAANGLTLSSPSGTKHCAAHQFILSTEPSAIAAATIILVATKSADTASAIASHAPYFARDAVIISCQNGLTNTSTIIRELEKASRSDVTALAGMVEFNVSQKNSNTFHRGTSGVVYCDDHPQTRLLAQNFAGSEVVVKTTSTISAIQNAKLLLNLNNALNALSGLPLKIQLKDKNFRYILAKNQQEALRIFQAAQQPIAQLGPLSPQLASKILTLPTPIFSLLAKAQLSIDDHARSSMSDDFQRNRLTEIAELQGYLVELGAKYHIPTPISSAITAAVKQAEAQLPAQPQWTGQALRTYVFGAAPKTKDYL